MLPPIASSQTRRSEGLASRRFAAAGLVLLVAHGVGVLGPIADYTFVVVGSASMIACPVGVRRHKPSLRWPWFAVMLSMVLFVVSGGLRAEG